MQYFSPSLLLDLIKLNEPSLHGKVSSQERSSFGHNHQDLASGALLSVLLA